MCGWYNPVIEGTLADMGWAFNAAHDVIAGRDPYRHAASATLVPYPLTAALVVLPFALLPGNSGVALLFGLASGLMAYGLMRDGRYWRLMIFATPAFLMAVKSMQWSPLFVATLFYPLLAPALLAKPTLALPIALSRRWPPLAILLGLALGAASLLVMPGWPTRWLAQTKGYDGFLPVTTTLGPLFLSSLLFWRNPQARLFALLTVMPQHRLFYDQLLVWLIPQTRMQMLFLTLTGWIAFLYVRLTYVTLWAGGPSLLLLVYLPAYLIVLWQQPRVRGGLRWLWARLGALAPRRAR